MRDTNNWVPSILLEDACGCRPVPLLAMHLTNRTIFITSEIDDVLASEVISQLYYLAKEPKDINIFISSPGGSVIAGMAIYDAIQALKDKLVINIFGYSMVASMAAVLLASGHPGHRFLMPNAKMLLHEPLINSGIGGSCSSITQTAEKIIETKKQICEVLAKHCNKSIEEIEETIAGGIDVIMNAEESLKYGLVDGIKTPFDR